MLFGRRGSPRPISISTMPSRRTREHGERKFAEDELEMCDLQPLRRQSDLTIRGEGCRPQMGAEGHPGFGRRDDKDGSLNTEHVDLSKEHGWLRPSGRSPGAGCSNHLKESVAYVI